MIRTAMAMRDEYGFVWDEPKLIDTVDLSEVTGWHLLMCLYLYTNVPTPMPIM